MLQCFAAVDYFLDGQVVSLYHSQTLLTAVCEGRQLLQCSGRASDIYDISRSCFKSNVAGTINWVCEVAHGRPIGYLAFLFEVYWSLSVSAAGDVTGLLQSLVEARDVLFHFFQRRQQRLALSQQRQTSLPYLTTGKREALCKAQAHDVSLITNSVIF